jgi:signal transduction histidine kinase
LRSIASASAQQSADLEMVAQGMGNLEELTQRNSEMVTQGSHASKDLVTRAASLTATVSSMKLRQGSADEAAALVSRARALVKRLGLENASDELHSTQSGFVDRDMYIFVIDRTGHYRIHGAKRAMEGKRVHEVPGVNGDRFLRDALATVDGGGGWINYDIVNPENGTVQPKASYVVGLDRQFFIGCGVYRHTESDNTAVRTPTASNTETQSVEVAMASPAQAEPAMA